MLMRYQGLLVHYSHTRRKKGVYMKHVVHTRDYFSITLLTHRQKDLSCMNCLVYVKYYSMTNLHIREGNEHAFTALCMALYY